MSAIDVSNVHWTGTRARCPACGRATSVLLVLATAAGAPRCPSCARAASP
jgi:hypothetical protein